MQNKPMYNQLMHSRLADAVKASRRVLGRVFGIAFTTLDAQGAVRPFARVVHWFERSSFLLNLAQKM